MFFCNLHRTGGGIRRSKLEVWVEAELRARNIHAIFNSREAIGSELDIWFPDDCAAVELNGIFHVQPIHGEGKLEKIQENDQKKKDACQEKGLRLLSLDTSHMRHWKDSTAKEVLGAILAHLRVR